PPPSLEDYLRQVPEAERIALLRELLPLEAAYRRQRGETPRPEDYQACFPDLDAHWLAAALEERPPGITTETNSTPESIAPNTAENQGHSTVHPREEDVSRTADREALQKLLGHSPPAAEPLAESGRIQQIRCPHCHNPLQLTGEHSEDVLCPGCGSSFRVRDARETVSASSLRLGKFQLLERVGLGAFGAAWKALDTELGRMVALKVPHSGSLLTGAERQ